MKKITFGFSTTEWPLSKAIRFLQKLPFSHSYVQYRTTSEQELIYEAAGTNTHLVNKKNFDTHNVIVEEYEIEVEDHIFHQVKSYIEFDIGVSYGWGEIVGLLIMIVLRFLSFNLIKIDNPFPSDGKVCSSASAEIYVKFLGGALDEEYDDIDLIWMRNKLIADKRFKRIK